MGYARKLGHSEAENDKLGDIVAWLLLKEAQLGLLSNGEERKHRTSTNQTRFSAHTTYIPTYARRYTCIKKSMHAMKILFSKAHSIIFIYTSTIYTMYTLYTMKILHIYIYVCVYIYIYMYTYIYIYMSSRSPLELPKHEQAEAIPTRMPHRSARGPWRAAQSAVAR